MGRTRRNNVFSTEIGWIGKSSTVLHRKLTLSQRWSFFTKPDQKYGRRRHLPSDGVAANALCTETEGPKTVSPAPR
jgi:hypothetical protein